MSSVRLYRDILRLHRTRLPSHLRALGDDYVRAEFRAHRDAKPEHLGTSKDSARKQCGNRKAALALSCHKPPNLGCRALRACAASTLAHVDRILERHDVPVRR